MNWTGCIEFLPIQQKNRALLTCTHSPYHRVNTRIVIDCLILSFVAQTRFNGILKHNG